VKKLKNNFFDFWVLVGTSMKGGATRPTGGACVISD